MHVLMANSMFKKKDRQVAKASVPHHGTKGGGRTHSPGGEGVGDPNSDDWRKRLSTLYTLWLKVLLCHQLFYYIKNRRAI
jgi:hypothetical protein